MEALGGRREGEETLKKKKEVTSPAIPGPLNGSYVMPLAGELTAPCTEASVGVCPHGKQQQRRIGLIKLTQVFSWHRRGILIKNALQVMRTLWTREGQLMPIWWFFS